MRKVSMGIIGCGVISKRYIQDIQQFYHWVDIKACADLNLERAKEMADTYHLRACTTEELLADDSIEMVLNLTVPQAHIQIDRQILQAGKHLYTEKPFALSLAEAEEIINMAKSRGLLIGCSPETFLGAGLQTARRLLDSGEIGQPVFVSANMVTSGVETWHPAPYFYYQKGSGPLWEMAPYYFTAMVFLLGPIRALSGLSALPRKERTAYLAEGEARRIPVEVPTTYVANLEFESGVIGSAILSYDGYRSHLPQLELYGVDGVLELSDPNYCGGSINLCRKEEILDHLGSGDFTGNESYHAQLDMFRPQPSRYPSANGAAYTRGLGPLDLAFAIANNTQPHVSTELAYHVLEAIIGLEQAIQTQSRYVMKSTCRQPEPLPEGLPLGDLM